MDNGSRRREEADSRAGGARHPPPHLGGHPGTLRERRRRGIVVEHATATKPPRPVGAILDALTDRQFRLPPANQILMPLLTELWVDCSPCDSTTMPRLRRFGYPNGIASFSPALPMASATPGKGPENRINPDGVASFALGTRTRMLQPLQGWISFPDFTQGSLADSATRGLMDGIPLG